jgi:hypothetical protein
VAENPLAPRGLQSFVVAVYVEQVGRKLAAASVKPHLAVLRTPFAYMAQEAAFNSKPRRSGARSPWGGWDQRGNSGRTVGRVLR